MDIRGLPILTTLSLKARIAIVAVALVLVTTILVTSVSLILAKRGMKDIIADQQYTLLSRTADEIDQKFYARQVGLQSLAAGIPQASWQDSAWLQRYVEQHAKLKMLFDNLLISSVQGELLANLNDPATRGTQNFADRRYVKDTLALRKGVISAPLRSVLSHKAVVVITAPILDQRGKVALIVAGTIDLEQDNFLGQVAQMKIGRTGYFFAVTGDGIVVSHPQKSRTLEHVDAAGGNSPGLERAFGGFEGTIEGSNRLGAYGLFSFKRVKSTGWILGAVYPEVDAFASIAEVEKKAVLAAALLAILVGPLAWWITRRQIAPLQRLYDRIQAARLNPRKAVAGARYRADEIGKLARAFDDLMRERMIAEAELQAAVDSSLDAFYIFRSEHDAGGKIVDFRCRYLNANAERMLGLQRQQALGRLLSELAPTGLADGFFDKYVQVLTTGQALQEEFPLKTPPQQDQWRHHQVVPLAGGVAVTTRDITERKRNEVEMRNNRAFLQSLIDYMPLLVFSKSLRAENFGQVIMWNKAAEVITGYPASNVVGKTDREIFPPEMAAAFEERDRIIVANPAPLEAAKYPFQRPDGAVRFLHAISLPIFDEHDNVEYILGIAEDVTVRRSVEKALLKSEQRLRLIADHIPALIAYVDQNQRFTFGNRQYEHAYGVSQQEIEGKHARDVLGEQVYAQSRQHIEDALTGVPAHFERFVAREQRWERVSYVPDIDVEGAVAGFFSLVENITELKETQTTLANSEARLRTITDNLPIFIAYIDRTERYRFCNGYYEVLLGMKREEILGGTIRELLGEQSYADVAAHVAAVLRGERTSFERHAAERGLNRQFLYDYIPDIAPDGQVAGFYAMVLDITARKKAELRLLESEQLLRAVTDHLPALVSYIDKEQRFRFNNRPYEKWLGQPLANITGRKVQDVYDENFYRQHKHYFDLALQGKSEVFEFERSLQGAIRHYSASYVPQFEDGELSGVCGMIHDITALKQVENQLRVLVRFDSLTGLANRLQFDEKLAESIARSRRSGRQMAVMFLDIDHFKSINDTLGHHGGDQVLREFAQRLLACVRHTDTVARLAGDEFVIILEGLKMPEETAIVAQKIIHAMTHDFQILGMMRNVTTSIGIAIIREGEGDADALLRRADEALYQAKSAGRNTYRSKLA